MFWTLWLACKPATDVVPVVLSKPTGCDPVDPGLCALPWPSSTFQREGATGMEVFFPPGALPTNRDNVELDPTAWNELDGFSIWGPLLTLIPNATAEGLPAHTDLGASLLPDSATVLLDVDTGERVPHFVEVDLLAEDVSRRVLTLRPMNPMRHGHRHIAAIRRVVLDDGTDAEPSDAFRALRDGESTTDGDIEGRRDHYDNVIFPALEAAGLPRSELLLAWDFTTVSRERSLGKMLAIRDDHVATRTPAGPTPTFTTVEESDCELADTLIWKTIEGTFPTTLYTDIDAPTAVLTRDANGLPYANGTTDVGFLLRVPCSVKNEPGGAILQYGHGLLGTYDEARGDYLASLASEHRFVILAQDWTGMATDDAGALTLMLATDVSRFRMIPERSQQGFVELMAGLHMARTSLVAHPDLQVDGVSVIDPDQFAFYGNSQGGILGGAYTMASPDIERAVLGVPGMPYSLLLSRSADFEAFFLIFKAKYTDDAEISLVLAALQTLWDPGEPSGYAWALDSDDPLPGIPDKRILIQAAIGDAQVTTLGAQVMARAWGASTIAPQTRPIWDVDELTAPFEASGIVEWAYSDVPSEPLGNVPPDPAFDTHECPRREPAAQAQLATFLREGRIEMTCDGPCLGVRADTCP